MSLSEHWTLGRRRSTNPKMWDRAYLTGTDTLEVITQAGGSRLTASFGLSLALLPVNDIN